MQELVFLIVGFLGLSMIAAALLFLTRKPAGGNAEGADGEGAQGQGGTRTANREHDDDEDIAEIGFDLTDEEYNEVCKHKVGSKKRKKILQKIQKKRHRQAQRQEELEANENRRKKMSASQKRYAEREKQREEEEARREAAKAKAEAEAEVALQEEFDEWAGSFETTEQGAENNGDAEDSKLSAFISRIEKKKVVLLSDLSIEFGLSSQLAVDRVKQLEEEGTITGVIDDRGKFIYVSSDELEKIADLVKSRGRISVSELVREINTIVDLNAGEDDEDEDLEGEWKESIDGKEDSA